MFSNESGESIHREESLKVRITGVYELQVLFTTF